MGAAVRRRFWHHFFGVLGVLNILIGVSEDAPVNLAFGILAVFLELSFPPPKEP